jgi:GNAT superfamily N-acetyltransferase
VSPAPFEGRRSTARPMRAKQRKNGVMKVDPQDSVRKGTHRDRGVAVDLLVEAFADDPLFNHLLPATLPNRRARLSRLFHLEVARSQRRNATWLAADHGGVMVCYPPAGWRPSRWESLRETWQWRYVFGRHLSTALTTIESMESQQRQLADHWFLSYAAVAPDQQRRGVASDLMKAVLHECDQTNMPAYLEANDKSRNLALRHGFRDRRTITLPHDGPTIFSMWREPEHSPADA